jgi:uncharacterized protein YjlB
MISLAKRIDDPGSATAALWFTADGWVPNNPRLPVLFYRGGVSGRGTDPAAACEDTFRRNGWPPEWRNGVYPFHHYHSTAHEILGFVAGTARLLLGGPNGHEITVHPGDCALLPAGTGHCRLEASPDLLVVGGYPPNQSWDLRREAISEVALREMAKVPFPNSDPVLGPAGPLLRFWSQPVS